VEAGNQVTVTVAGAEGNGYSESSLVAKLSAEDTYSQTIGGKAMVITVVSVDAGVGKARVRISENGAPCGPVPPSPPPTPGPTATPCPEAEVTVDILTDAYPKETSWILLNTCSGDVVQESVAADTQYQAQNTQYSDRYCVPSAVYRFSIFDAYGDGMCCGYGSGSYSVAYDGKVEASGGDYQSSETSVFGSCGATTPVPTPNPTSRPTNGPITPVPTDTPTPLPTKEPTPLPTKEPTLPPTPLPTNVLTDQPTKSPTMSPAPVPTDAPTPLPTKEPTLMPSLPPTDQSTTDAVTTDRMLYCGIPNKCNARGGNMKSTDINDRAGVRCCTTNESLGWSDKCQTKSNPRVFGASNVPTCNLDSTFQEAVDICAMYDGGRLCTGEELTDKCTKGTGCQLNNFLVWGCTPGGVNAETCENGAECCSGSCNDGVCV